MRRGPSSRVRSISLVLAVLVSAVAAPVGLRIAAAGPSCGALIAQAEAAVTTAYQAWLDAEDVYNTQAKPYFDQIMAHPAATTAQKNQAFQWITEADNARAHAATIYQQVFVLLYGDSAAGVQGMIQLYQANPTCPGAIFTQLQTSLNTINQKIAGTPTGAGIAAWVGIVKDRRDQLQALLASLGGAGACPTGPDDRHAGDSVLPGLPSWRRVAIADPQNGSAGASRMIADVNLHYLDGVAGLPGQPTMTDLQVNVISMDANSGQSVPVAAPVGIYCYTGDTDTKRGYIAIDLPASSATWTGYEVSVSLPASFSTPTTNAFVEADRVTVFQGGTGATTTTIQDAVGARVDERFLKKLEPGLESSVRSLLQDQIAKIKLPSSGAFFFGYEVTSVEATFGIDAQLEFEAPGFNGAGPSGGLTLVATVTNPKVTVGIDPGIIGNIGSPCHAWVDFDNIVLSATLAMEPGTGTDVVDFSISKLSTNDFGIKNLHDSGVCNAKKVAGGLAKALVPALLPMMSDEGSGPYQISSNEWPIDGKIDEDWHFSATLSSSLTESDASDWLNLNLSADPLTDVINQQVNARLDSLFAGSSMTGAVAISSVITDAVGLMVTFDLQTSGPVPVLGSSSGIATLASLLSQRNIGGAGFGTPFDASVFVAPRALSMIGAAAIATGSIAPYARTVALTANDVDQISQVVPGIVGHVSGPWNAEIIPSAPPIFSGSGGHVSADVPGVILTLYNQGVGAEPVVRISIDARDVGFDVTFPTTSTVSVALDGVANCDNQGNASCTARTLSMPKKGGIAFGGQLAGAIMKAAFDFAATAFTGLSLPAISIGAPWNLEVSWISGHVVGAEDYLDAYLQVNAPISVSLYENSVPTYKPPSTNLIGTYQIAADVSGAAGSVTYAWSVGGAPAGSGSTLTVPGNAGGLTGINVGVQVTDSLGRHTTTFGFFQPECIGC